MISAEINLKLLSRYMEAEAKRGEAFCRHKTESHVTSYSYVSMKLK